MQTRSAVNTAADDHGGGDAGQQGWIWRWRRCGTATDEMWDNGDGEMGCKDGDGLGKYQQGTTAHLRVYCRSGIMGMAEKISGEYSSGRSWCRICRTTGMDTAVEEMWEGNRIDVGQRRWLNGLEERRQIGKISTGDDYQSEGVLTLQ